MWYAHLHLIKVVYLRDNMWLLPIRQEMWFRHRVCLSLEAQGTEREDAMISFRKGFKSKTCVFILSALLKENICTCFLLSTWFSFWHWIKVCLSSCSSWFSRAFSRHFWVCWSDNTSSSLCIDWISFLQWHSRSTTNVVESESLHFTGTWRVEQLVRDCSTQSSIGDYTNPKINQFLGFSI